MTYFADDTYYKYSQKQLIETIYEREANVAGLEASLRQAKKLLSQNAETMSGMTHSNILLLDRIAEFGLKSCTIDLTTEQVKCE